MQKISKYKQLGQGWHNDSIRHSNAKKFGIAGGLYADLMSIKIGDRVIKKETGWKGKIINVQSGGGWLSGKNVIIEYDNGRTEMEDLREKHIELLKNNKKNIYAKKDIVSELNNKEIVVEKVEPKEFSQLPIVKMKEDEGYSVDAVSDIHNNPDKIEIKIKDSGNDEKNSMLLAHEFNEIEKFKKINKNGYKQGSEELAHQQNNIKY